MISIKLIPVGEALLPPLMRFRKWLVLRGMVGTTFWKLPMKSVGNVIFYINLGYTFCIKIMGLFYCLSPFQLKKCHRLSDLQANSQIGILGTPGSTNRLICVWWELTFIILRWWEGLLPPGTSDKDTNPSLPSSWPCCLANAHLLNFERTGWVRISHFVRRFFSVIWGEKCVWVPTSLS